MKVTLTKEKETKNAFRFKEDVEGDATPVISTLYVQKTTLETLGNPDKLEVTIEASA